MVSDRAVKGVMPPCVWVCFSLSLSLCERESARERARPGVVVIDVSRLPSYRASALSLSMPTQLGNCTEGQTTAGARCSWT